LTVANHLLMVLDAAGGLVWEQNVADNSASASGVSAQDLTGNGAWEIIWNGATDGFLIINGPDGRRLYNEPYTGSGTVLDYPTLADVDGDGEAEDRHRRRNGLFVIGHTGRWVDSRPVWNQHNYHINNINNDWSIPFTEENSWEIHNTYRTQTPDRDPSCVLDLDGNPVPPTFVDLSPASGESLLPADRGPGHQRPRAAGGRQSQPAAGRRRSTAFRSTSSTRQGSFFSRVELGLRCQNSFELRAMDRCAERLRSLELNGGGNDDDPWADLADASVLFEPRFSATTHDPASERLLTRVQAFNAGPSVPGPVLMTIGGDAAPSIGLLNADGVTPQGEPYAIVVPDGDVLGAGALSAVRDLTLSNRQRAPIDFTPRWIAPDQPAAVLHQHSLTSFGDPGPGRGRYRVGRGRRQRRRRQLVAWPTAPAGMTVVDHELDLDARIRSAAFDGRDRGQTMAAALRRDRALRVKVERRSASTARRCSPRALRPRSRSAAATATPLAADRIWTATRSTTACWPPRPASLVDGSDRSRRAGRRPRTRPAQPGAAVADDGRGGQATQAWTLFVGEAASHRSRARRSASVPHDLRCSWRPVPLRRGPRDNPSVHCTQRSACCRRPPGMVLDPVGRTLTWVPSGADLGVTGR
jgi:hypothetical protein